MKASGMDRSWPRMETRALHSGNPSGDCLDGTARPCRWTTGASVVLYWQRRRPWDPNHCCHHASPLRWVYNAKASLLWMTSIPTTRDPVRVAAGPKRRGGWALRAFPGSLARFTVYVTPAAVGTLLFACPELSGSQKPGKP